MTNKYSRQNWDKSKSPDNRGTDNQGLTVVKKCWGVSGTLSD